MGVELIITKHEPYRCSQVKIRCIESNARIQPLQGIFVNTNLARLWTVKMTSHYANTELFESKTYPLRMRVSSDAKCVLLIDASLICANVLSISVFSQHG